MGRVRKFGIDNHRYLELIIEQFKETPINDCIEWPFASNVYGYGQVWLAQEQRLEIVHREAHFLYYGEYPEPFGLHTCDNPPCFNPFHIYAGTAADNGRDRREKPVRHIKEAVGQDWDALLDLLKRSVTNAELARQFGITEAEVQELRESYRFPSSQRKNSIPDDPEQIETILGLAQRGCSRKEIAYWFDTSVNAIDELIATTECPRER